MWQLSGLNGDDEEENTGGSDGDGDGDGDAAERDKMWSQHKFAIFWLTAGNPVFCDKKYFNVSRQKVLAFCEKTVLNTVNAY